MAPWPPLTLDPRGVLRCAWGSAAATLWCRPRGQASRPPRQVLWLSNASGKEVGGKVVWGGRAGVGHWSDSQAVRWPRDPRAPGRGDG